MMLMPRALVVLLAALSGACWVEPDGAPPPQRDYAPSSSPAPSASAPAPTSQTPLLVKVDTGRTLNAEPGQGVGIFVEYAGAGQWHVWWTCDTATTGAACTFDLRIKSETGELSSIRGEGILASDTISSSDAHTVDAHTNTGSNAVGVNFAAPSGGIINIDASVGGVRDSSFFFFVQDGKPNGGYSGPLTDPLRFVGSAP